MTLKQIVVVAAALLTCAIPMRAQSTRKLEISFDSGRVTIVAENVTLAEILAEWSRKGGSRIVNAEQLRGGPVMPTEFRDRPEAEVLRTLLREAPGYGAVTRAETPAGASTMQTVFIHAVRAITPSSSSAPIASQVQQSPVAAPRLIQGSPDDEIPPVRPLSPEQNAAKPSTPGPAAQPNSSNLRQGPGGITTSTIPGVPIPAPTPTPANAPKPAPGRGGGGGSR